MIGIAPSPGACNIAATRGEGPNLSTGGSVMRHSTVTLGDLIASCRYLEIGCHVCRLHLYIDPAVVSLPGTIPVPDVCDLLKCPQCGAVNVETGNPVWARPDARPPKMGATASRAR